MPVGSLGTGQVMAEGLRCTQRWGVLLGPPPSQRLTAVTRMAPPPWPEPGAVRPGGLAGLISDCLCAWPKLAALAQLQKAIRTQDKRNTWQSPPQTSNLTQAMSGIPAPMSRDPGPPHCVHSFSPGPSSTVLLPWSPGPSMPVPSPCSSGKAHAGSAAVCDQGLVIGSGHPGLEPHGGWVLPIGLLSPGVWGRWGAHWAEVGAGD